MLQKIKQLRKQFDGRTQEVRGSLIADLEWLQQYASDKVKTVKGEKNKQKWTQLSAYVAQTM